MTVKSIAVWFGSPSNAEMAMPDSTANPVVSIEGLT